MASRSVTLDRYKSRVLDTRAYATARPNALRHEGNPIFLLAELSFESASG